jgi:adenosylcobinamide-GDP ribazoletransferase
LKRFLIALQFLTILPIKVKPEIREEDFGKSLIYFPLVGMLIGFFLILILLLFDFLPYLVKAAFILGASIIITGGIHLDGFADTCDGLYGFRTKEKALEIMRDSRIGAMGAIGITLLLLLKFALLASILKENLEKILILMPIFARWAQVFACFCSSYARQEGKAKYFIEYAGKKEIFIGTLFTLVSFLILMRTEGLILFTISYFTIFLFINWIKKKIGGMTGDTIGSVNEVAEGCIFLFGLILAGLLYGR